MYEPINPLGYSCIKKLQRDNLWHAYNEPINFYSVVLIKCLLYLGCMMYNFEDRREVYGKIEWNNGHNSKQIQENSLKSFSGTLQS